MKIDILFLNNDLKGSEDFINDTSLFEEYCSTHSFEGKDNQILVIPASYSKKENRTYLVGLGEIKDNQETYTYQGYYARRPGPGAFSCGVPAALSPQTSWQPAPGSAQTHAPAPDRRTPPSSSGSPRSPGHTRAAQTLWPCGSHHAALWHLTCHIQPACHLPRHTSFPYTLPAAGVLWS